MKASSLNLVASASVAGFCIAFFAIPGTIVHWHLGHIDWHIVFSLSIGVIPASYLGSKAALAIKSKQLQAVFGIFLIAFGIYFIMGRLLSL